MTEKTTEKMTAKMTNTKKFLNACYWVGCTSESATRLYFDSVEMLADAETHYYITAFDEQGKWVMEAYVDEGRLVFDYWRSSFRLLKSQLESAIRAK